MSQAAQKGAKIDSILHQLSEPDTTLPQLFAWIEERSHAKETQYRAEKEAREEQYRIERAEAERRAQERADREAQRHEMFMAMMASVFAKM
ncbi:unnamed protein product [Phytophthora fragariaefolia]|uniref:Unnamed protein product n=1 Tax=Phytophthora fragariaefolia TaxID=1490495 RepID=A0A9W7D9Y6_9STRA|nr:unnamed protein product [Phytophthora fragariaefolia]